MKICVILNPAAGSAENTEALRGKLERLGSCEIETTAQSGDAQRFAHRAVAGGCDLIVSAGGDGTLNEVVNGIAEQSSQCRVGILPLGTGK